MNDSKFSGALLEQVEKEIAELLINKLEHEEITVERAAAIARFTLHILPEGLSDEEVMEIIPKLDDEYFELAGIVHKYMNEYEEKYKPVVLEKVNELVKHKHFDEASNLMKSYFNRTL